MATALFPLALKLHRARKGANGQKSAFDVFHVLDFGMAGKRTRDMEEVKDILEKRLAVFDKYEGIVK